MSHFEVVETEGVNLVFEDIVTEGGQHTRQQQWHQDGRHDGAWMGVATFDHLGRQGQGHIIKDFIFQKCRKQWLNIEKSNVKIHFSWVVKPTMFWEKSLLG